MAGSVLDALNQPLSLAMTVMDLRAYARTKAAMEAAKKAEDAPKGEYADMVLDIQAEIAREIMMERKRKRRGKP